MIRCLVLAMILFCFNSTYSAENLPGEKADTTRNTPKKQTDKTAKVPKTVTAPINKTITETSRPLNTSPTETQEKKEEKSPNESWWHKLLSDPVAFFTSLLVFVTGLLWWSTRSLVLGSERTARQQLRAYVFTKHEDSLAEDSEGCTAAIVIIKNFGQTPADDMVSDLEIGLYEFPLKSKLELTPKSTKPSKSTLAPGEQVQQFTALHTPLNGIEKRAIAAERAAIFVHGEVRYVDAFKKHHTTRICLYSTGDAFDNGMLAYYHEGNNAD